jgi:hypothetical protein
MPSPDGNGNPFVPVFGAKDCNGQQEIALKNKFTFKTIINFK